MNNHNTVPPYEKSPLHLTKRGERVAKSAVALTVVGAFAPITAHLIDVNQNPIEYSHETTVHLAGSGESPWSIAEEIPGSNEVPLDALTSHIMSDPANVEALKDGLQVGESLVIPTHVSRR